MPRLTRRGQSRSDVPMISVLTPTFNRPAYLRTAIASVVGQSFRDLELIVCDDGDNEHVLAEFDDDRIVYLPGVGQSGVLRNSQRGWARARGRYIATLFDDDLWHPDFLAALVEPLEHDPTLSVAFSEHWIIDAAGRIDQHASAAISRKWGRSDLAGGRHEDLVGLALVTRAVPVAMAALMRRSAIDLLAVPAGAGRVYDLWLASQLALSGGAAWYEPRRLTSYRSHDASCTALGGVEVHAAFSYCWRQFATMPAFEEHRAEMARRGAISDALLAAALVRAGHHPQARQMALRGVVARRTRHTLGAMVLSCLPSGVAGRALGARERVRTRRRGNGPVASVR